ncbi:MAG TPA: hypothetical protein DCW46_10795 [Desulfotomaculum sp.]|nr:hypothetical protein [Desulfotomaculum sp.]
MVYLFVFWIQFRSIFKQGVKEMKKTTTSWVVTGLGAAVTTIGATALSGPLAAGAIGFGAAHIALGLLDMVRSRK